MPCFKDDFLPSPAREGGASSAPQGPYSSSPWRALNPTSTDARRPRSREPPGSLHCGGGGSPPGVGRDPSLRREMTPGVGPLSLQRRLSSKCGRTRGGSTLKTQAAAALAASEPDLHLDRLGQPIATPALSMGSGVLLRFEGSPLNGETHGPIGLRRLSSDASTPHLLGMRCRSDG